MVSAHIVWKDGLGAGVGRHSQASNAPVLFPHIADK